MSLDRSGLVVVKTVDTFSHEVVAQQPSEAYLRLANAMQDAVEITELRAPSGEGRFA